MRPSSKETVGATIERKKYQRSIVAQASEARSAEESNYRYIDFDTKNING